MSMLLVVLAMNLIVFTITAISIILKNKRDKQEMFDRLEKIEEKIKELDSFKEEEC